MASSTDSAASGDLIRLEHVTLRVGGRWILPDTSWTIAQGQNWVVLGPNGSGKTSLTAALTGEVPVVAGRRSLNPDAIRPQDMVRLSFETHQRLIARDEARDEARGFAGIDEQGDTDRLFLFINLRDAVDIGEGISQIGESCRDALTALHDGLARKGFAAPQPDQRKILLRFTDDIAGKANVVDRMDRTFGNIDSDVDVLPVGRDRDLSRLDLEIDIAAVQIIRTQSLEVASQSRARILVVLRKFRQPSTGRELELIEQIAGAGVAVGLEHGHQAAISIHLHCQGKPLTERLPPLLNLHTRKMGIHEWSYSNAFDPAARRKMRHEPLETRFDELGREVELGFDAEQTAREVERCLNCDIQTVFFDELCIECDACIDICPTHCLTITPNGEKERIRGRLKAPVLEFDQPLFVSDELKQTSRVMVKDENFCIHCGLCAERCPTAAWDMQKSLLNFPKAGDHATDRGETPCQQRKAG